MSVEAREPQLDSVRAANDAPVSSAHGADIMASRNACYERITGEAAPGAGSATYSGHVHDHNGDGAGISRGMIGHFYAYGLPLTHTTSSTTGESMGNGATSHYEASGADFILGTAYVSPGQTVIRCEVSLKTSVATYTPQFRIVNLTDTTTSQWITLTTSPVWYNPSTITDINVAVVSPGAGAQKRIELDIEVKVASNSETISFYGGYVYEHTDA